jgi:uncharacterized protein GlcG (DUF336 family)
MEIRMVGITLDQANSIATGALKKGLALGLAPITVIVVDAGGHLVALQRQDGSGTLRPQIAIAKATGALGLGVSSRKIGEIALTRPTFVSALSALAIHGVVPAAGGVIVVGAAGLAVGAVGVTGDSSDNDEACAIAGILHAGLMPQR